MIFKKKRKQEPEHQSVEAKENLYGYGRYTGKDINELIQDYGRLFPARVIKSENGYSYGIKHPSGFNLTARYWYETTYITGAYRGIGGDDVVLQDHQLDALVDKLYPIMVGEMASENLRISQLIEEVK
jgi:hypothetical protein